MAHRRTQWSTETNFNNQAMSVKHSLELIICNCKCGCRRKSCGCASKNQRYIRTCHCTDTVCMNPYSNRTGEDKNEEYDD